jgi:hypothetical protein
VIAFLVRKAEQALFQYGILFVPQSEREANMLMTIGNSGNAVFAPAIGARAGVVVREIVPRVTVGAVILADRAPLPLG